MRNCTNFYWNGGQTWTRENDMFETDYCVDTEFRKRIYIAWIVIFFCLVMAHVVMFVFSARLQMKVGQLYILGGSFGTSLSLLILIIFYAASAPGQEIVIGIFMCCVELTPLLVVYQWYGVISASIKLKSGTASGLQNFIRKFILAFGAFLAIIMLLLCVLSLAYRPNPQLHNHFMVAALSLAGFGALAISTLIVLLYRKISGILRSNLTANDEMMQRTIRKIKIYSCAQATFYAIAGLPLIALIAWHVVLFRTYMGPAGYFYLHHFALNMSAVAVCVMFMYVSFRLKSSGGSKNSSGGVKASTEGGSSVPLNSVVSMTQSRTDSLNADRIISQLGNDDES